MTGPSDAFPGYARLWPTGTRKELRALVHHDLTLHPPATGEVASRMDALRHEAHAFGHALASHCPLGAKELDRALEALDVALFHGIAAIARNQPEVLE